MIKTKQDKINEINTKIKCKSEDIVIVISLPKCTLAIIQTVG